MFKSTCETFMHSWRRGEFFGALFGPVFLLLFWLGISMLGAMMFWFFYILPSQLGNPYLTTIMAAIPVIFAGACFWCKFAAQQRARRRTLGLQAKYDNLFNLINHYVAHNCRRRAEPTSQRKAL